MNNYDDEFYDNRLQLLKQATILNYFDELSLDNNETRCLELLDCLLEHLYKGDLDFCFQSKYLMGTDDEEKEEIFKLMRKYVHLCFYAGKSEFWLDSVEGVTLGGENPDFVCMKILDNYDFLLGVINTGGENALKILDSFNECEAFNNTTLVDNLRNHFLNDDILRDFLVIAAEPYGEYKRYNIDQLAVMCLYPEGILYDTLKDGSVRRIDGDTLNKKLMDYYNVNSLYDLENILSDLSSSDFENVIFQMYYDKKVKKKVNN